MKAIVVTARIQLYPWSAGAIVFGFNEELVKIDKSMMSGEAVDVTVL